MSRSAAVKRLSSSSITPLEALYDEEESELLNGMLCRLDITSQYEHSKRDIDSTDASEERDGAWAKGKAPLSVVAQLLAALQRGDAREALTLVNEVRRCEPGNSLFKEYKSVLEEKIKQEVQAGRLLQEEDMVDASDHESEFDFEEDDSDEVENEDSDDAD